MRLHHDWTGVPQHGRRVLNGMTNTVEVRCFIDTLLRPSDKAVLESSVLQWRLRCGILIYLRDKLARPVLN